LCGVDHQAVLSSEPIKKITAKPLLRAFFERRGKLLEFFQREELTG
jgi:hypothetical protein